MNVLLTLDATLITPKLKELVKSLGSVYAMRFVLFIL